MYSLPINQSDQREVEVEIDRVPDHVIVEEEKTTTKDVIDMTEEEDTDWLCFSFSYFSLFCIFVFLHFYISIFLYFYISIFLYFYISISVLLHFYTFIYLYFYILLTPAFTSSFSVHNRELILHCNLKQKTKKKYKKNPPSKLYPIETIWYVNP